MPRMPTLRFYGMGTTDVSHLRALLVLIGIVVVAAALAYVAVLVGGCP
jgi:hypothetical protein